MSTNNVPPTPFHRHIRVFSGIVTACQTHVNYERPFERILRSLFSGEPCPLSDTISIAVIRLEDPELLADDILVYGCNAIRRGDYLVVEAEKHGRHYIARGILRNGRQLLPHRVLPAFLIRLALLNLLLLAMVLGISLLPW